MANLVSMWIKMSGNSAAKAAFSEVAHNLEKMREQYEYGDAWVVGKVLFGVEEMLRDDDRLGGGASWVFVEEADSLQIHLTCGWRPAFGVGEEIFRMIVQHDSNARLYATFQDEMPNFCGGAAYGLVDGEVFRTDQFEVLEDVDVLFESQYQALDPDEADKYITWDDVSEKTDLCMEEAIELLDARVKKDFSQLY
jgi:hypothetical protein